MGQPRQPCGMAQGGEGCPGPPEPLGPCWGSRVCMACAATWQITLGAQGLNVSQALGSQQPPLAALRHWSGSANSRNVLGWLTPRAVGYQIRYLMYPCWNRTHAHQPQSHPCCLTASSSTEELFCTHRHKHKWGWPLLPGFNQNHI